MKKICLFIAFMMTLVSCSKDLPTNELAGEWHLIEVSSALMFDDFKKNKHVWDFDVDNNQVIVKNKKEEELQMLESGTYDIEITDNKITIESTPYDYYFSNDRLDLGYQVASDGPRLIFVRK